MSAWHTIALKELTTCEGAVMVSLASVKGSAPRAAGTQMLITCTRQYGTIGGGKLEYDAAARAREILAHGPETLGETMILGPDLGQCCGGQVALTYERLSGNPDSIRARLIEHTPALAPLYLFGAGHVGKALVQVLDDLPFAIFWVDMRPESFAHAVPHGVTINPCDDPLQVIKSAPKNAFFLVMTHDHNLDYKLISAILQRHDFGFCGLIGSKTKRARFARRLQKDGIIQPAIDRVTCPIGLAEVPGKAPKAIAISVAAQLLTLIETD